MGAYLIWALIQFGRLFNGRQGSDLNHLLGFYLYDENHQVIKEGKYDNPYFQTTDGHQPDVWEYHQNRLLSADTAGNVNGDDTTGKDWLLLKNAKYMVLRFGVCYGDNDGKGESWFAFPKVVERFPESGLASVPHKVNFLGRWDIPVAKPKWTQNRMVAGFPQILMPGLPDSLDVGGRGGIAFRWGSYLDYFNEDLEEMIVRPCITYSDTIGQQADGKGFTVTLKRIPAGTGRFAHYGGGKLEGIDARLNDKTYPADYVFFKHQFLQTWSGNSLFWHICLDWELASKMSCGHSWTNTCQLVVEVCIRPPYPMMIRPVRPRVPFVK